jgi:hypothetical protein
VCLVKVCTDLTEDATIHVHMYVCVYIYIQRERERARESERERERARESERERERARESCRVCTTDGRNNTHRQGEIDGGIERERVGCRGCAHQFDSGRNNIYIYRERERARE